MRTLDPAPTAALALMASLLADGCARPASEASPPAPVDPPALAEIAEPPAPTATASAVAAASAQPPPADAPAGAPWPYRAPEEPAGGDRIYSKVRHLWIRPQPGSGVWLGYLSLGDSVRVKGGDAASAKVLEGAAGGSCEAWYAVEPRGVVCVGRDATLDPRDPQIVELTRHAADRSSPWPYQYGESIGTPVYRGLPDRHEQTKRETDLAGHLDRVARARGAGGEPTLLASIDEQLVGVDLQPGTETSPALLKLPPGGISLTHRVVRGSTLAYTADFAADGRSWLLTWERGVVPKDKVRPYPRSGFHGVVLGKDAELPLAFFREKDRPSYRRRAGGGFEPTGDTFARLSWVPAGEAVTHEGVRYVAVRGADTFFAEADATVAERNADVPRGLLTRPGRGTWVDISVLGGTLVAYERDVPVYATLISPGRGGVPHGDVPPLDTASTPLGTYAVVGKFLTATMVSGSNSDIVHAEVQYTQNFDGPYALHGAYWHDGWGEKKSGGCVNLSPIDSQRVFEWTEPQLPAGWHGMRAGDGFGPMTVVRLRR